MKRLNCESAPKAIGPYSVASKIGNLIFTSGQLPIDSKTGKINEHNIAWQTEQSLKNVRAILEENGSSLNNVIKATVFLDNMEDFGEFNKVYEAYFQEGNFPARTAIEVAKLPLNALIEIEVIAKVDKEEN